MNKEILILKYLKELFNEARCELNYQRDYELLMAVVLSAQTTDKRVNEVTKELFKYNLKELKDMDLKKIEAIIRPIGTYKLKASYIKEIARLLVEKYNSKVPKLKRQLLLFPGVGNKTYDVVVSNLFDVPRIAVDTHVSRVSQRLGLVRNTDPLKISESLKRRFPRSEWTSLHHRMVLFGRYLCMARKPKCEICKLKSICKYYNSK